MLDDGFKTGKRNKAAKVHDGLNGTVVLDDL